MDFYEDYLTFANGRYELHYSASREESGNEVNCTYAVAMIKRLAQACIEYSKVLSVDADRVAKWQDIVDHMSAYATTTVDGTQVFKESENRDRITLRGKGDNPVVLATHPSWGRRRSGLRP